MAPVATPERRWLDEHSDAWVGAGLISPDEARAIREYESEGVGGERPERFGLVAEVAAYLGSVLALMGGAVVVGSRWSDLTVAARLGLAAAIALVGLTAGAWLASFGEPGTSRLGGFLRVLGTSGVGGFVGVALHELDVQPNVVMLFVGAVVAALSLALWRNLDRPLQLISLTVGAGIALVGFIDLTEWPVWWAGVAVWIAGSSLFVVAAVEVVQPRLIGELTGFAVAMIGSSMLSDLDEQLGPTIAAVTAAAVVAAALRWGRRPLLIAGVIGFLIAVQALLETTFTSVASSAIVALVGLAIVTIVIVRARRPA